MATNLTARPESIALTTVSAVHALFRESHTDASSDTTIAGIIESVSSRCAGLMNFHTRRAERSEVYELRPNKRLISLTGWPISKDTDVSLKCADRPEFDGVDDEASSSYIVNHSGATIRMIDLSADRRYVQVTCTSGLAVDTAAAQSDYPEIAHACSMQVAHQFRRLDTLGGNVQSQGTGATIYTGQYKWLDDVLDVLTRYRREFV